MITSYIVSLFFLAAFAILNLIVFWVPKSSEKMNGVIWIPITFVITIAFNALIAAIINFISIPVNIISIGLIDFVMAFVLWWFKIRKREKQEWLWKLSDFVTLLILFVIVIIFSRNHYGLQMNPNFQAVDAPKHLLLALDIVNTQKIASNMFYADLYGALFIETLSPLVTVSEYYKLFVLSEILNLFVSGSIFYALLSGHCSTRKTHIFAVIMSVLYLCGYPLHNALFGFVYWGMGVTLITCIIFMLQYYTNEKIDSMFGCLSLLLFNFGLFESYALFVPPIYLASFLYIIYQKKKSGILFEKRTLLELVIIYLPAVVLGLAYSYALLKHVNVNISADSNGGEAVPAIALEGGIYKDIYRDFIFFLPLAFVAFAKEIRQKKISPTFFAFVVMLVYMIIMFWGGMKGVVSSYYYCKNNYVMWLVLIYAAFCGVKELCKHNQDLVIAYFFTWGLIALLFCTKAEEKIAEKNENFVMTSANNYMNIYAYNRDWNRDAIYGNKNIELYQWMYDNIISEGKKGTISADFFLHEYWFQAVTNQRYSAYESNYDVYLLQQEPVADYVCVLYDSFYYGHQDHFNPLERVFENEAGFIAKLH